MREGEGVLFWVGAFVCATSQGIQNSNRTVNAMCVCVCVCVCVCARACACALEWHSVFAHGLLCHAACGHATESCFPPVTGQPLTCVQC